MTSSGDITTTRKHEKRRNQMKPKIAGSSLEYANLRKWKRFTIVHSLVVFDARYVPL